MSKPPKKVPSIGEEGRRVRERFKKLKRATERIDAREKLAKRGGPAPASVADTTPDDHHFHICYLYEDNLIPHWAVAYARERDAYLEVKRMGDESEPNTIWHDDGRVTIETRLHDRTGLHRITLGIAPCISTRCRARASGLIVPTQSRGLIVPFPTGGKLP